MELLQKLYGNVLIPKAVYSELTENPAYSKEAEMIKTLDFLKMVSVENAKSVNVLRSVTGLDAGESETLIMYDEQNADLLLMGIQYKILLKSFNRESLGANFPGLSLCCYYARDFRYCSTFKYWTPSDSAASPR